MDYMQTGHSSIKRFCCWWLLVIFSFAIMPHQFIHDEITQHEDTEDVHHNHTTVSSHHIHCDFLRVVIAPFFKNKHAVQKVFPFHRLILTKTELPSYKVAFFFHFNLRGPPTLA